MSTAITDAITANIAAMLELFDRARERGLLAHIAMHDGDLNLAVGNVMDLDQLLPEIDTLYRAVMLLHRDRSLADTHKAARGR